MKWTLTLFMALTLAGCSAEPTPAATSDPDKPFFTVDKNGSGPLTMTELQINIPPEVNKDLSKFRRACHLRNVKKLAAAAGDPATLNPANVDYLPTDGTWEKLKPYHKRNILAQAIVSRAFATC